MILDDFNTMTSNTTVATENSGTLTTFNNLSSNIIVFYCLGIMPTLRCVLGITFVTLSVFQVVQMIDNFLHFLLT